MAAAEYEPPVSPSCSVEDQAERSVWDEPGISSELAGEAPADAITWIRWYHEQVALRSVWETWLVTALVALSAGFAAILGALIFTPIGWAAIVVAAPVTEEIMKIAIALWIVEKRPWLFSTRFQILVCGVCSGLAFAVVENGIYLNIYISNPSADIIAWRWTVCVALHAVCSLIASIGVCRIWTEFQRHQRQPQLIDGASWITLAMLLHGAYNAFAVLAEAAKDYF